MIVSLIVFILLQLADGYTTMKALKSASNYEANPVMKFLMQKIGKLPALALMKILMSAGMSYAYVFSGPFITLIPNLIYVYVIYNNVRVLKGIK